MTVVISVILITLQGVYNLTTAQVNLARWNFPNNPDDAVCDGGIPENSSKVISGSGINSIAFNNGGATTRCATATGWDFDVGNEWWEIEFETTNYYSVTIQSKQKGFANRTPRDFKIQYKIGSGGTWTDAGITCTAGRNAWNALTETSLPAVCDNQQSVFLRWVVNSNVNVNNGYIVDNTQSSGIDDIIVRGTPPYLTATPSDLDFGFVSNGSTSSELTYSLSGKGFTPSAGNITVTAPANFEVSLSTGSGFASSLSVPYSGGTLASTTIYVRFKPTAKDTNYTGNIINSGGGVTAQNVAVAGNSIISYCTSNGNTTYQTSITLVDFNTLNNSSAKPSGYSDYTSQVTDVVKGNSYNLTVNLNTDGNYTIYARAWIDWNGNGSFSDAGEAFDLGSAVNTTNGPTSLSPFSITVPAGAIAGTARMRISARYNSYPATCETDFDGEVEDYTLNIIPAITVYYSRGSDPTALSNWNTLRGGGGSSPTSFTADNQTFVVQSSNSMIANSVWSVSGNKTIVEVENGASLTANAAVSLSANTTFKLDNNATYNHNVNSASIWNGTEVIDPGSYVVYGFAGGQEIASLSYGTITVTGGNTKTIQGDVIVNKTINLANGNLSLGAGANNLTIAQGATITTTVSFDNQHMIVCDGTGSVIKQGTTATGFAMIFPTGTGTYYTPFEISGLTATVSGTGTISVRAATGKAPGPPTATDTDLRKYWVVTTSNLSEINASIKLTYINPGEIGTGGNQSGYVPFFFNGSVWSQPAVSSLPGVNPMTVTGATTLSGQWTARKNPTTYYSYRTGNWSEISTWTTDPSGTLQIGSSIPGEYDKVIILSDRIVTLSGNVDQRGIDLTIEAGGVLDQYVYSFTNSLSALRGQGILKLASANFPASLINTFVNTGGGTTEYYNSNDFTFLLSQTDYNNLTVNCSGHTGTQLNNLNLNGNLYVKSGTFCINDNTSSVKLTLSVNGNVTVDNGAFITIGNGVTNTAIGSTATGGTAPFLNYYQNFHTVIIKGNFTNNGVVKFTNLPYPVYNAFPSTTTGATTGAASVYFQGESDNTLTCNGSTTFYNLIVNKGTDQTYKLTINSTGYSNFRLFGANILPVEGAITGNPLLRKALWIYSGTLVLKGSLVIPSLSEGTASGADYYIPSNGAMIADGTDVVILSTADDYREVNVAYNLAVPDNGTVGITRGGYSALEILGKLQINSGFLSTRESGGIITSSTASGQLIINGGTVDTKQFLSSTGTASFSQSGGLMVLRGRFQRIPVSYAVVANLTDVTTATLGTSRVLNGINSGYGSFNLENTGNIFTVSGGTIRIYDVTSDTGGKAFDVKSSSSNINVTGGTLELIPTAGSALSDAASYLINSTASVYNFTVNRASSSSVVSLSTTLVVKNNFRLTSGALAANSNNLTVGGNFTIENGTTYTPGNNSTILNGSGNQLLTINGALSLYNFTMDKAVGDSIKLAGSQNVLDVTGNFNLTLGTLADAGKTVNIYGNVYNSGVHCGSGAVVLKGTALQTVDGNGIFQNIEMNNTNSAAAPVSLVGHMTVKGQLKFSNDKLFNINTFNLKIDSLASFVNAGSNRFIQTSGNTGDGGVTRVYKSIDAFIFPVGVGTKYTPATIGFTTAPGKFGSVTVIPVNYEHPVTTINGQSLKYYWHVKSSGFTGIVPFTITHQFVYASADVVGTETGYVPAIYDATVHTWYYGMATDINTTTNTISDWTLPTNSTNFLDADYTAGLFTSFGTPKIFYSYQSGLWSSGSSWSLTSHTVADQPATAPGANDIVIIGGNDSIYLSTEAPPENNNYYRLNEAVVNCASLQIEKGAVLDIQNNPNCTFASVLTSSSGNGKIRLTTRDANNFDNPEAFVYPHGDFSEFSANGGISEFYTINSLAGTYYVLPSNANSYGTVILTPLGGSNIIMPNIPAVTINGDLICNGSIADAWLAMTWWANKGNIYGTILEKTVTVKGNLKVLGGSFIFIYNNNTLQKITIDGDVYVAPNAAIDVQNDSYNNLMSIGGSLINNSNYSDNSSSLVRFLNNEGWGNEYSCDLIFNSNKSALVTNIPSLSANPYTVFGNVTINKGSSQDSTMTWNIGGTLTTPTDDWLTLQNGTLVYDRTGDFYISEGTDFNIPATAGLKINTPSDVYISNNASGETLFLNGKLTLQTGGGNVYIGPIGNINNNADIEYSGSGASEIEVQGSNLFVNGQIRRPLSTTNGILKYKQSGGNVIIYGNNSALTKAKLEVLNEGSVFSMSGGTLSIVRGGGTTFGDLYLRPTSSTVTGGSIIFTQSPVSGTVIDSDQSYHLDANIALNNLALTGLNSSAKTANLLLMISPLKLRGSLTLSNSYSVFNSNSIDVTIAGDMINNGSYIYGTNTTTFNGSVQNISGTSVSNFYNLIVSPVTYLSVNHSFNINSNLSILAGNLALTSYEATLLGNLNNSSSFTDDNSTGGIGLRGAVQQFISGAGYYGRLTLDNSNGAKLNNSIALNNNLILTNGVFDINQYQLTLGQNSTIVGAPFSTSKMIKTDGVSSSLGVMKYFNPVAQNFTFPVGVAGKYTPSVFRINGISTVGSIKVVPVDAVHPSVTDAANALNYYWHMESSGISGFTAIDSLKYYEGDVKGTESSYVAARLNLTTNTWEKAVEGSSTDNVDEVNHKVFFIYSSGNDLNGDYTAGGKDAIPENVATYRTNSDGYWSDKTIWTPVGTSPECPDGGPAGCVVIIDNVVTINSNHVSAINTTINNKLIVDPSSYGHSLGIVHGNGTLYLNDGNIPAGTYTDFFDCSGDGTLEYGGSGTYNIIATLYSSIPNIRFSGGGSRILPNKDLTICKSLVIDGPVLDNSLNNRKLTILGTMERYNGGAFNSGSGNSPYATVTFSGATAQTIGGAAGDFYGTNKFNNLEINNPSGLTIKGKIEVGNNLLLTNGIIYTTSSDSLIISNTSSTAVVPENGSSNSFVSGPLTKKIVNGETFVYPVGKGTKKGHDFTVIATGGSTLNYTVEYFTPNTTATSISAPLKVSNTLEYWGVSTKTGASAKVKIGWDPSSDLTPLTTDHGITDIRVAEYISNEWTALESETSGDEYNGYAYNTGSVGISSISTFFTTAAVSGTIAKASFSSTADVCGMAGIPVTFTSFDPISLNYTIEFSVNGGTSSSITVSSLPFDLPTPSAGRYVLKSFRFNNNADIGIVDTTSVMVYESPEKSNAGTDQSLCGLSTTILQGNDPSAFSGLWEVAEGTGGNFDNNNKYDAVFTGNNGSSYKLTWTISNGTCASIDTVVISFPVVAPVPDKFTSYSTDVCQGSTGNLYTVTSYSGVIYNWSYSGNDCIITGTENSVTITFGPLATSGTLSVTTTNDCGTSTANTLGITVSPLTWTGTVNSDWNTSGNWTCGFIPSTVTNVVIPDVTNEPVLSSGSEGTTRDLTINSASSLTVTGNTLAISGTITNNGLFTATDGTVEFNGTSAQSVAANLFAGNTIDGLTVDNASGVALQGPLNVTGVVSVMNGNLTSDGNLTLISSAVRTALIDGSGSGNVTGNVTMQRYLSSGFGYKYFSSPFQSATVSEFGDDMDLTASFPTFYGYDENRKVAGNDASGWYIYTTPANVLSPLAGYAVNFGPATDPKTVDVTGVVNNGSLSVSLSNNNNTYTQGFNLVGNPYPSPIDWNAAAGWTKTNINNAVYYFTAGGSDQYSGTYSTYIGGVSSDGKATAIIPSMQGFFVRVSEGAYPVSATLGLNNSVRVNDLTHAFLKSAKIEDERSLMRLTAEFTDLKKQDPTVVYFKEYASDQFDGMEDAIKLMNTDKSVPNFYLLLPENKQLAINSLPYPQESDSLYVIPAGIKTEEDGWVTFKLKDNENMFFADGIYLRDAKDGKECDLLKNDYKVFLKAGEYKERFFIELTKGKKDVSDKQSNDNLFSAYGTKGMLNIKINYLPGDNGILRMTNTGGQLIYLNNIYETGIYEIPVRVSDGIYFVTLTSGEVRVTKKVLMYR